MLSRAVGTVLKFPAVRRGKAGDREISCAKVSRGTGENDEYYSLVGTENCEKSREYVMQRVRYGMHMSATRRSRTSVISFSIGIRYIKRYSAERQNKRT
ncbi:hypothetical protein M378DRAFT_155914 [Amanita muscaria Koide BX008]|uniref:Uncharacterized protein n=1 Tax=Amanita muscaria (strain Koide BX008) TaxID=946122 RepID=A0A0C2TUJ9_AMAMK|nr:hypothetical protein M378DRAFT_155914 [Amanita muscaria Koide BX008]